MNKNKIFSIIIIVLLLLNVTLVSFMMFQPKKGKSPRGKKHEGPKNIIIEKLQFDASQIANYEELIVTHRDQVQDKDAQIRERKKTLYSLLTATETQQIDQDSLLNSIGTIQKEIELLHFHHFQKIKKICTPKQVPAFTALAKDLVKIFKPQKARDPKIPR